MDRTRVTSTSIAAVGYDGRRRILEVEFTSGAIYQYRGVARSTYDAFLNAESKGRFMNSTIRDEYPYIRVR